MATAMYLGDGRLYSAERLFDFVDSFTVHGPEQAGGTAQGEAPILSDAPPNDGGPATFRRALATLETLEVKGRAPMTGYDRAEFGPAWSDAAGEFYTSRSGLDTRNEILYRDLVEVTCRADAQTSKTGACAVEAGILLYDPYSGDRDRRFNCCDGDFTTDLDAEHVVALGDAWAKGAQAWTADRRAAFANDPLNLMMVDPALNRQKGAADFATWLPPNRPYRCAYAARQVKIKAAYDLWVTPAERDALNGVLAGCSESGRTSPTGD